MILTRLCGGLGNQMFQYAAGRAAAASTRSELVLDLGWYRRTPSANTLRDYELGRYAIQARVASEKEQRIARFYSGRILRRLPLLPRPWRLFREQSFAFDAALTQVSDNTYLDGYWQSYRYLQGITDTLRDELTPRTPGSPADRDVGAAIRNTCSVSVHVRRGDYVTQKAAAGVHGVCSPAYYESALRKVGEAVGQPHFFVFSDDSRWTRDNLSFPGPVTFVEHNGPATAFQDLRLMSQCRHHVIANSSFSWWGAWLNPRTDKLVVSPEKWFADGRATPDLIPPEWIRL